LYALNVNSYINLANIYIWGATLRSYMPKETLEQVMESKIKPIIENAMQEYLGIKIDELEKDLSEKLKRNPLIDFKINTKIKFKEAKQSFKQQFLKKLLILNYGNVSEVANIADVDRRSIHRLITEKEIKKIRSEMIKPYHIKMKAVNKAIEGVLDYWKDKEVLSPKRLNDMYENVNEMSDDILEDLPLNWMSLKEAEEEFEKAYLKKALKENNNNVTNTAKKNRH